MTNAIVRQTFQGQEIQAHAETAALAIASHAKAAIEARWIIAKSQPRNMETVRQALLKECLRPSFAAVAIWHKPIGDGIEGLSIRFVEAGMQALGNIDVRSATISDDEDKRIVEVSVTDFQRNVSYQHQITVTKLVERIYLRKDQVPVSQRQNSNGKTTYLVHASEDDLLTKEGALISKAIRTCGLRIIPGWLQDECMEIIRKTRADEAARDPDAEMRKLLDAFGSLGVMPADLEEYLAHPMSQIVPAELVQLRAIYSAVSAGEATWVDTLAHRTEMRGEDNRTEKPQEPAAPAKASKGVQGVKDALKRKGKPPGVPDARPEAVVVAEAIEKAAPPPAKDPPAKDPPATDGSGDSFRVDSEAYRYQEPSEDGDARKEQDAAYEAAQARLDSGEDTLTTEAEKVPEKRPGRGKAAREAREAEVAGLPVTNARKAELYILYGDPRNFAKGYGDPPGPDESPPAVETVAATPEVPAHDAETGEVVEDEPAWLSDEAPPPKGEGF